MRIFDGARVTYRPRLVHVLDGREGTQHAGHQGVVVNFTTDGFYRIRWDNPNPDPTFFNLERVFAREDIREV